jgi:hypothetical protein
MSMLFDYKIFYDYYSDPTNSYVNNSPIQVYYFKFSNGIYVNTPKLLTEPYFVYNNTEIYITLIGNDQILFTIVETDKQGINWANHFHIGTNIQFNVRRKIKKTNTVFMHFSKQDYVNNKKDMSKKCNFRDKLEDLNNIENILCTNKTTENLKDTYEHLTDTVKFIMRQPFFPPSLVGGKRLKRTNTFAFKNKQKLRIYEGPRGGKYININGKFVKH